MNTNRSTKEYYSANFKEYLSLTQNVDMSEHYDRFLKHVPADAKILDVGFGSARDMLYFREKGYTVQGIDNVREFVDNARALGLDAEVCDFHSIPYRDEFDGIWASASLLHSDNLPLALSNLRLALKPGGFIYISMKIGEGARVEGGRFYQYINVEEFGRLVTESGLSIAELFISDDLLARGNNWINAVLTKKSEPRPKKPSETGNEHHNADITKAPIG